MAPPTASDSIPDIHSEEFLARLKRRQLLLSGTCAAAFLVALLGLPLLNYLLPNAMVATLTFLPFVLNSSITTLTSLDFLGFGLPPTEPSWGDLLHQAKENWNAWWILGPSLFALVATMVMINSVGEALQDAFDLRRAQR